MVGQSYIFTSAGGARGLEVVTVPSLASKRSFALVVVIPVVKVPVVPVLPKRRRYGGCNGG
jgi:hypothetical protein